MREFVPVLAADIEKKLFFAGEVMLLMITRLWFTFLGDCTALRGYARRHDIRTAGGGKHPPPVREIKTVGEIL